MLAIQAWGVKCDPQQPHRKTLAAAGCALIPALERWRQEHPWALQLAGIANELSSRFSNNLLKI